MLSLLEVPVAFLNERARMSRTQATLLTIGLLAVIGSTAALSNSWLSGVKPFGLNLFDLYDYATSNILLPVGGIFISLFAGWFWGFRNLRDTLTNQGTLRNGRVVTVFYAIVKFVSPPLIVVVLLSGLGVL